MGAGVNDSLTCATCRVRSRVCEHVEANIKAAIARAESEGFLKGSRAASEELLRLQSLLSLLQHDDQGVRGALRVRAEKAEAELQRLRAEGWLSQSNLVIACRNIGFDLTCGACAMLFYTGYTGPTARHDAMPSEHTCSKSSLSVSKADK